MSDDVKIYQPKNSKQLREDADDIQMAYEFMNHHRANGNIQKAQQLGQRLAELSPDDDTDYSEKLGEVLLHKYFTQDIRIQIRVLTMFAAQTLLQGEIKDQLLSVTAVNSMFDRLKTVAPGFAKNLVDGVAFGFYFAALKRDGVVEENVGKTFAELCDVPKNDGFINAGKSVWSIACKEVRKMIAEVDFSE